MRSLILLLAGLLPLMIQSCVPSRIVDDIRAERDSLQNDLNKCEARNNKLQAKVDSLQKVDREQQETITMQRKTITKLEHDTSLMGSSIRKLSQLNEQLNESYEQIISNKQAMLSDKSEKTEELLAELNRLKESMRKKEKELIDRNEAIQVKEMKVDSLRRSLHSRNERIQNLEKALAQKDSSLKALRDKISDALVNLKKSGLSVEMKNSKVYVSLQEKLLFESGQYELDSEGKSALQEIGKVLKENPSVNIMVEGHTDDQKVKPGSEMQDNWELSVLRATEVVRYLSEKAGVNPERLIAAGRGPYAPVVEGDSPEARRKNRRTELILTPQMDQLFEILETNN